MLRSAALVHAACGQLRIFKLHSLGTWIILPPRSSARMSLPEKTTVLIIGAGPSGLSTAISLVHHGCRDIVIVEEKSSRGAASRAMSLHASTLEVYASPRRTLYGTKILTGP